MERLKIAIVTWSGHHWALKRMNNLAAFHSRLGHRIFYKTFSDADLANQLKDFDLVYVWNGSYPKVRKELVEPLYKNGTRIVFVELGWFPQAEYVYFDQSGTNAYSELISSSLDWLDEADFAELDRTAKAYRGSRTITEGGYVFVPLQLPHDTQVALFSPYKWMGEFVRHVRWVFRGKRIIFRRHPKDPKTYADLNLGKDGEGDLMDLICNADLVYGLNSTVLLEAALLGKQVTAIGASFLNMGPSRRHALAALVARQVHWRETDFLPWTRPGRGMEHLLEFL